MLRGLLQAHISRVSTLLSLSRSVRGTRSAGPTLISTNIDLIYARTPVETENKSFSSGKFAFPWSREAGNGFQSQLFAMTGGNTSEDSDKEQSAEGNDLDRYSNYRGLEILRFIGFEITELSATKSTGRFVVSKNSCQPFNVLHGGTTAYIAESIASVSASVAADFQRVAGIELTCSHLRSVPIGSEVEVTAVPLRVGRRIQVWEVKFETLKPEKSESRESRELSESSSASSKLVLSAISRVTLLVGLPITPDSKL